MKNTKRVKQMLGILSILPTFTGLTEAKPITPNPTTEIKLLKDEAKPCPMTIESKQESTTLGLTNTQMGILLLGMLVLPVTGIKASEKGYELVKPGFEKLQDKVGKWYAPFAHRHDIKKIKKLVNEIREQFNGSEELEFTVGTEGVENIKEKNAQTSLTDPSTPRQTNKEKKEWMNANIQKLFELMMPDQVEETIKSERLLLQINHSGILTCAIVKITVPANRVPLSDMEIYYRNTLNVNVAVNAKETPQPRERALLHIEYGEEQEKVALYLPDNNKD